MPMPLHGCGGHFFDSGVLWAWWKGMEAPTAQHPAVFHFVMKFIDVALYYFNGFVQTTPLRQWSMDFYGDIIYER